MEVENNYFLVKFQGREEYERVLSQGSWVVFVCFLCGKYGHVRDLCPSDESEKCRDEDKEGIKVVIPEKVKSMAALDPFGPRMFVERKSRRNQSSNDADMSGLEQTMQAKDFDGIKAHFNPVFEGPMGVGVQLTNDILDPASHSIVG
ncbi:hypothetical protein Golax_025341 [Gossypium laxum]|uniref:CCHC-type domain-containing protein n=1 Tax=Gossypium laxum TaxID=34288 RepID=A0A7J9B432_9ROSI|nr:hypothetical protein [Gossypium laxum]